MAKVKASLICTALNEENTIASFIDSIVNQSLLPSEVIIVDGGSKDKTALIIKKKIIQFRNKLKIKLFIKKGNRSVGRNEAIRESSSDIVLSSDSGNVLDKNWVKNILKPFSDISIDVVAGFYKGKPYNVFENSLIPYVLVMSDRADKKNFLPATRSMAFKKSIWKKVGGFDEKLSHNEDYAFAQKLKDNNAKIVFAKSAIVYWIPRKNIFEAFKMFFRFSLGDIQAGIVRDKVALIFLRYIFAVYLIFLAFLMRSYYIWIFILLSFLLYIVWSILKNYKYVSKIGAFYYLPLLQFVSDFAVILGTLFGLIKKITKKNVSEAIYNNKFVLVIVLLYFFALILQLNWGVPNASHPFNYSMDDWHASNAVRAVFKTGTSNGGETGWGSMFYYISVGLFTIPFYFLGFVNPFLINSSVTQLAIQEKLFEVYKLHTLFFGAGAILLIYYISKKYLKINPLISTLFFTINPIWITLSGYVKYDVPLIFFILLFLNTAFRFVNKATVLNLTLLSISCGLAIGTKLSGLPLIPAFFIIVFLYGKRTIKFLLSSLILLIFAILIIATPDLFTKFKAYYDLLFLNSVTIPQGYSSWTLKPYWVYTYFVGFFSIFGYAFYALFLISGIYILFYLFRKKILSKEMLIVLISFIMIVSSLIPLKFSAASNIGLVLLPFFAIFVSFFLSKILIILNKNNKFKKVAIWFLIFCILVQFMQTLAWYSIKFFPDPRATSSTWIRQNIKKGETIGIENIPIYKMIPDYIEYDFYLNQYGVRKSYYNYVIINSNTKILPNTIIISKGLLYDSLDTKSDQKKLINRLNKDKYKIIANFTPNFTLFKYFDDGISYDLSILVTVPRYIRVFKK